MSLYTNDTDTLRQMINQSIPQTFAALISVITVFIVMLTLSVHLTLITILMVLVMLVLTKKIGGKSGKYFIAQQNDLSTVNGYIEEMLSGQKDSFLGNASVFLRKNLYFSRKNRSFFFRWVITPFI